MRWREVGQRKREKMCEGAKKWREDIRVCGAKQRERLRKRVKRSEYV